MTPTDNFYLLILLILLVSTLFGWLLAHSYKWTGPSHDVRFASIEDKERHLSRRVRNLEDNTALQLRAVEDSIKALYGEVHLLASRATIAASIIERLDSAESHNADNEQGLQFVKDFGCGHPECPRLLTQEKRSE